MIIHNLETNKIRNTAKFYGHLLQSDSLNWSVFQCIRITEDDTTSGNRIYIKILFETLREYMGMKKLSERLQEPHLQEFFSNIFPKDLGKNTVKNATFAINFFTSIEMGPLTDDLREFVQNADKILLEKQLQEYKELQ